jgi:hypothetical protein
MRHLDYRDALKKTPRLIISMNIYGGGMEIGYNQHYLIHEDIKECLRDFFERMIVEHPEEKPDIHRSKLEFRYVDLPKEIVK